MIKKGLYILTLPYLFLILLEGCNKQYNQRGETRNITDVFLEYRQATDLYNPDVIILNMEYESYFVSNFRVDILNKSYAKSLPEPNPNGNFEGFSNPFESISIKSANDYSSTKLAGAELNKIFVENFFGDTIYNNSFNWEQSYRKIPDSFGIQNLSMPTIDSIHTLFFEIKLSDNQIFRDTLVNVNLNKTYKN